MSETQKHEYLTDIISELALAFSQSMRWSSRAMLKWRVLVADCLEEVDLILWKEKGRCNGVHWRISPALIIEIPGLVEMVEEGEVVRRAEKVEVGDLEI